MSYKYFIAKTTWHAFVSQKCVCMISLASQTNLKVRSSLVDIHVVLDIQICILYIKKNIIMVHLVLIQKKLEC